MHASGYYTVPARHAPARPGHGQLGGSPRPGVRLSRDGRFRSNSVNNLVPHVL